MLPSSGGPVTATVTTPSKPIRRHSSASVLVSTPEMKSSNPSYASTPNGAPSNHLATQQLAEMKRELNHQSSALYHQALIQDESPVRLSQAESQLDSVLDELRTTESKYVGDLKAVIDRFWRPMQAMVEPQQHQIIFSNLKTILALHSRLEKAASSADVSFSANVFRKGEAMALAFVEVAPYFKCYATYCANYPYVAAALLKARESEQRIAGFLDDAEAAQKASLQALLFRPVQRMCVYPLLFQQARYTVYSPLHRLQSVT